jgi:PncC family amidohydrolase
MAWTAERLVEELIRRGVTCASAESCTGGGVGRALTSVPGSSAVFVGGLVASAERIKRDVLGVETDILGRDGPVSAACAERMASRARDLFACDYAVSTTGLAGPSGDGVNPVGCVWFAVAGPDGVRSERQVFAGDREAVREAAVSRALALLGEAACG